MKTSLKLSQIESKISALQSKKQQLLAERQKEIAALIAELDIASFEDKVLIGGFQFLKHKITAKDPLAENWHSAGERFFRYTKRSKNNAPKKDKIPLPAHQPPQKLAHSREK